LDRAPQLASLAGETVIVGIRPEAVRLSGAASSQAPAATVLDVEALGNEFVVRVETQLPLADMELPDVSGGESVAVRVPAQGPRPERGDCVHLDLSAARFSLFDQDGTAVSPPPSRSHP
jgi:ABC-type sugar transport system ATPase subunit